MTVADFRATVARPTQKRKFATVPLKREPLTHGALTVALNRRGTNAAASVGMLRLEGYAPDMTLGCLADVEP